jgi:hypothetical protein
LSDKNFKKVGTSIICAAFTDVSALNNTSGGRLRPLELPCLDRFAVVVLDYSSIKRLRSADDNVSQPNVILCVWSPATNPHHQPEPQRIKYLEHLFRHPHGRHDPLSTFRQTGDHHIVRSNPSQYVVVVVATVLWQALMMLIQHGPSYR